MKEKQQDDEEEGKKDEVEQISAFLAAEKQKQKQKRSHQGLANRIKSLTFSEENFHIFKGNSQQGNDAVLIFFCFNFDILNILSIY